MRAAMSADLVSLWERVAPAAADALAGWYATQRNAALQSLAGVDKAMHYAIPERPGEFMTWMEATSQPPALDAAVRTLAAPSLESYSCEIVALQLMCDVGDRAAPDTPWLYIVHTDIPDDIVDEYNEWYDHEHLPRLVTVPGVVRARRYTAVSGAPRYLTAYSLTDKDAFESPEGLKARKTPWTARMRSLFQNTRRSMCRLL
jgi:hypothetical protein